MLTTLVMHPFQISQILQRLDCAVYGRLTDSLRREGRRGLNDCISRGIALEKPPDLFALTGEAQAGLVELSSEFCYVYRAIFVHT